MPHSLESTPPALAPHADNGVSRPPSSSRYPSLLSSSPRAETLFISEQLSSRSPPPPQLFQSRLSRVPLHDVVSDELRALYIPLDAREKREVREDEP